MDSLTHLQQLDVEKYKKKNCTTTRKIMKHEIQAFASHQTIFAIFEVFPSAVGVMQ